MSDFNYWATLIIVVLNGFTVYNVYRIAKIRKELGIREWRKNNARKHE